ncbi:hypothetical protein OSB04_024140 [Centaurea solstitialis]|uniref:Integrase catalytic domain-containing protein n=1 Tax=Centaurea solstitialis TaxID=347529 RepID=A0AA38T518_9ASTR|nr:hypothetical protein OSB04_024140 [Centaurea solstitialis]
MSSTAIPFYSPKKSLRLIMGKWKLADQKFPFWKMHLDNVLSAQGKRYVIEKPISRPKCNSPEKDFAEYFKFTADESDVMSILSFSISPEFSADLKVNYCHEVMKDIESQKVSDHAENLFIETSRLFKSLSRMGYKMVQEEQLYLMWFSLPKEIRVTASEYMGEPKMDVAQVHEDILAYLEPKPAAMPELMDSDWIDELGDMSCPKCGSKDVCIHSIDIERLDIGLPNAPGSGSHISNHLQGFSRRETLRKDRSNLRVGEGTMLVAKAIGSYSLSLPSGLVLEHENCYYVPNHGFYYKYDYKMISCFKNDIFYFKATPTNGLYVLNLEENNKEIYHISKRSNETDDQTYLWHCRLEHINNKRIEQLQKIGLLGSFDFRPFNNYESCLSSKMTKQPFNKDNERASELLGIIHTDVCGPLSHEARGGYRYFITFTDDFNRYGYVYLISLKLLRNSKSFNMKYIINLTKRVNRGGEYLSQEFDNHLMECGIVSQLTPPYTPQMNGVSERRNRTLLDMVRSMICRSTLPVSFWGHVLEIAAHILNRVVGCKIGLYPRSQDCANVEVKGKVKVVKRKSKLYCFKLESGTTRVPTNSVEKTPYEIWMGKKPKLSFLKIWGCEVYVKRPTSEKLKPKSDKCIFVGYPKTTVGYYFYSPSENKVFVARNGEFLEDKFLNFENTRNDRKILLYRFVSQSLNKSMLRLTQKRLRKCKHRTFADLLRVRQEPDRYLGFLVSQDSGDLNEPTSYKDVVSGNESEQWLEAMKAKMQSMYDNLVRELTNLP